jgi:hypothetical protein
VGVGVAEKLANIKSSWSLFRFFYFQTNPLLFLTSLWSDWLLQLMVEKVNVKFRANFVGADDILSWFSTFLGCYQPSYALWYKTHYLGRTPRKNKLFGKNANKNASFKFWWEKWWLL